MPPIFLEDFSTDNSASWQFDAYLGGGGDGGSFGGNSWDLTAFPGELYVASEAGSSHGFVTIAAAGHDFTADAGLVLAVQVVGHLAGTPRTNGISVGLANLTSPYNSLVASINNTYLGLSLGHSPDLASVLIDEGSGTDGFACDDTEPFWLALVLNGADTLACIYDSDPLAGSLPTPRAQLKWSDYAVAQGQPADPTTGLGTCVPQLGFWFTGISLQDTARLDNWEAGTSTSSPDLTITVKAKPNTIVADGNSQSKVTATVKDADDNPLAGQTVTFSADSATAGAAGGCGPTTDNDDGTYTCTYTSTIVSGDVKVTATDGSLTADCMIHQTPQAVGNMGFGPPKVGIVRQGRS